MKLNRIRLSMAAYCFQAELAIRYSTSKTGSKRILLAIEQLLHQTKPKKKNFVEATTTAKKVKLSIMTLFTAKQFLSEESLEMTYLAELPIAIQARKNLGTIQMV